MKSVQPFPRTVIWFWYFCDGLKKQKKTRKTSVKHIRIRLIIDEKCLRKQWGTDLLRA